MKLYLSKSAFIKGLICNKALFYSRFYPELGEQVTPQKQHLFDVGHEVDLLARTLFTGGKDMTVDTVATSQVIQNTQIALAFGEKILYQASFGTKEAYCRTDIFINDKKKKLFEVKSSTKSNLVNIVDVAFQYYILKEAGYEPDEVYLVYLNNEYVRGENLSVKKLFKIEDIKQSVLNMQGDIFGGIKDMREMLEKMQIPDSEIGIHCSDPYNCDFKQHCWKHIPTNSVFDIARLSRKKKFELYESGIIKMEDIPTSIRLNDKQRMQVNLAIEKGYYIDKPKIKEFISQLKYPLYFLDFESIQPAVPRYKGTKSYQQIVFQYSLHIEQKDGSTTHHEFLADPSKDFRLDVLKNLLKNTEGEGTILTYNKSFEVGRLRELAGQFPKYEEEIYDRIIRVKDLMDIFRERHFYHHEMKGSYSIKNVLPVLVPELSYKNLDIQDGGTASITFEEMAKLKDRKEIELKRKQLLAYCELDTLAMVSILRVLKSSI